jgi:hypothetical protein
MSQFCRQKLEGDKATQPSVFGLVDDSHTAAAQLVQNAVVRNGLAQQGKKALRPWAKILECKQEQVKRRDYARTATSDALRCGNS